MSKRPSVPSDWEQIPEARRRRHFQHLVQMEGDELGERCPTQCSMCRANDAVCRRYKPGVCDSVTACSFCKSRSVSCSLSSKGDNAPKQSRRTSMNMQNAPGTPEHLMHPQFGNRPIASPRGTPTIGPSSTPGSLFAATAPTLPHVMPAGSPQLLDTCVNRMLELQRRMLQFGNDLKSPTPDMEVLQKEQRAQTAEVAALMALILAERAK